MADDVETINKHGTRTVMVLFNGMRVRLEDNVAYSSMPPEVTGEAVDKDPRVTDIVMRWHNTFRDTMSLTDYLAKMFSNG